MHVSAKVPYKLLGNGEICLLILQFSGTWQHIEW